MSRRGYANVESLASEHPMWRALLDARASLAEAVASTPPPRRHPDAVEPSYLLEPEPGRVADTEAWRQEAAASVNTAPASPRPTTGPTAAETDRSAARLAERVETLSQATGRQADEATQRIAAGRRARSGAARTASAARGAGEWARREARSEAARLRAESARELDQAEREEREALRGSTSSAEQRWVARAKTRTGEADRVAGFMPDSGAAQGGKAVQVDTRRAHESDRALTARSAQIERERAAVASHRVASLEAQVTTLHARILGDIERLSRAVARQSHIELVFEPAPGIPDVTDEIRGLLRRMYRLDPHGSEPGDQPARPGGADETNAE
ncbi:MAG TPA: hypothetical protein PLD23_06515 [Armatimonadota bacterium]|nr:hypothetical protein [Armatimonadota bacterium]HQK93138.1 hypothetical protein [Armatimonadota bacterium]